MSSGRDTADVLATLTMAAQENRAFGTQLIAFLKLPKLQRLAALDNAVRRMELNREPPELRAAFAALANDDVVEVALSSLQK